MPPPTDSNFYIDANFVTRNKVRGRVREAKDEGVAQRASIVRSSANPSIIFLAPRRWRFLVPEAPAAIPCRTMLTDQGDYGKQCVRGDSWASSERNYDSMNYWSVDFETPSYQSNSCCSLTARLGFAGKYDDVPTGDGQWRLQEPRQGGAARQGGEGR